MVSVGKLMGKGGKAFLPAFIIMLLLSFSSEAAEYCAQYMPGPLPSMTSGQSTKIPFTVKNCGTMTWPANGQVRLAYHIMQGGNQLLWDGPRTSLTSSVGPNSSISLQANIKAAGQGGSALPAGQYTVKWDMVNEGVAWFSSKGVPTADQQLVVTQSQSNGTQLKISASVLKALCKAMNCDGSAGPVITSGLGKVTPGSSVIISGKFFGVAKGMVELSGAFGKRQPEILEWYDGAVGVKIPSDISGVNDSNASFVVRRSSDGKQSAPWSVKFWAAQEVIELPASAVTEGCSCNSDCDKCAQHTCGSCDAFIAGGTIAGNHETHWPDTHGDYGTDTFKATLHNGWTFYDRSCWGLKNIGTNFPAAIGSSVMSASVNWSTPVGSAVNYHCVVYIKGPKGVSYK